MKTDASPPLFASHGLVLLHVAREPRCTMRQLSGALGVSERRVAEIVRELEAAGMLSVSKDGKRNVYAINEDAMSPHAAVAHRPLGDLLRSILGEAHSLGSRVSRAPAKFVHSLVPLSLVESELPFITSFLATTI